MSSSELMSTTSIQLPFHLQPEGIMNAVIFNPLTIFKVVRACLQTFFGWSSSRPSILLTLTPNFNTLEHIVSLSAILEVHDARHIHPGQVLLEMKMVDGNVPSNDYQGTNAIKATDEYGILPLTFNDAENRMRYWYSSRVPHGIITIEFEAFPRAVNNHTPVGPRVDLRMDQGGIIGAGSTFIPVPPYRDTILDIYLNWNLSGAPEGTAAVWSFGDGAKSSKTGAVDVLSKSNFMVGPINKYTRKITPEHGVSKDFGIYWFGNPRAFDIVKVARITSKLFEKMAPFFKDTKDSYRVFLRFNPYRGFGGSGFLRSFVLEYDPYLIIDEDDLLCLLTHEMVHNWPLMEQESEGDSEEGAWYVEGMSSNLETIMHLRNHQDISDGEPINPIRSQNDLNRRYGISMLSQSWKTGSCLSSPIPFHTADFSFMFSVRNLTHSWSRRCDVL